MENNMVDYSKTDYSDVGGKSHKGRKHYVYAILDDWGDYVYIGCTSHIHSRLSKHRARNRKTNCYTMKGDDLSMVIISAHLSRVGALTRESMLISQYWDQLVNKEQPNIHKRGGKRELRQF